MASGGTGVSTSSPGFISRAWLPPLVALVLLACYWFTLAPTISEGDSGELTAAIHTMGVAHPTGYPLWLIIGKLFDLLPLGEPAHRIAFFSAVSTATAGGLICWVLVALTGSSAAGLLGGLAAGLNWRVWMQANKAEVYGFHALMICMMVAMFVRWLEQSSPRRLNQLAFACGLALTHHRTSLWFAAPMLLWAMAATRPASLRLPARTVGFAALPLLLYLWLPLRSAAHPPVNWGYTSGSLQFFFAHIAGSAYVVKAFGEPPGQALKELVMLFFSMLKEFSLGMVPGVGLALAGVGLVGLARGPGRRPLGISLIISFIITVVWAASYAVHDKEVFFMPALLVVSLWCGAGLAMIIHKTRGIELSPGIRRLVGAAAAVVTVAIPLSLVSKNWAEMDRSEQYGLRETMLGALYGVPADGVVVPVGDDFNACVLYYYYALEHRPAPLTLNPLLITWRWCQDLLPSWVRPAAHEVSSLGVDAKPEQRVYALCEFLCPAHSVYTNIPVKAPPGCVTLREDPVSRIVRAPGIPQAPDHPGWGTVLQFANGRGSLLHAEMPVAVRRGEPFTATAAVRWTGAAPPRGELVFVFAHSSVAAQFPAASLEDLIANISDFALTTRTVPLLFGAPVPASRPGYHYDQTLTALLPQRLELGRYRISVCLRVSDRATPLAPVGAIDLR